MGTAIEAMRAAQEFPVHTRHLYDIGEAYWWKDVVPQIDDMVRQRIRWDDYQRYLNDLERPAFLQELRAHEIGGRRVADVLDAITATPLDGEYVHRQSQLRSPRICPPWELPANVHCAAKNPGRQIPSVSGVAAALRPRDLAKELSCDS